MDRSPAGPRAGAAAVVCCVALAGMAVLFASPAGAQATSERITAYGADRTSDRPVTGRDRTVTVEREPADPTPTGKMVWFELDAAASATIDLLGVDALSSPLVGRARCRRK